MFYRDWNYYLSEVGDILYVHPINKTLLIETDDCLYDQLSDYKAIKSDGAIFFHPNMNDFEDYDPEDLRVLYNSEEKHFWFINRKNVIKETFVKYVHPNSDIIEIGAGTGNIAKMLLNLGYNMSVGEIHANGIEYAKEYGINKRFQFNLLESPFVQHFDVVAMFDVIEHIENEKLALYNISQMLKANGLLIVTVPAHSWLWSMDDVVGHHKRRYTIQSLTKVLVDNGFELLSAKYFFVAIIPLLFLRTYIRNPNKRKKKESIDQIKLNKLINATLNVITKYENKLLKHVNSPFGGSIIAVAKKRD